MKVYFDYYIAKEYVDAFIHVDRSKMLPLDLHYGP